MADATQTPAEEVKKPRTRAASTAAAGAQAADTAADTAKPGTGSASAAGTPARRTTAAKATAGSTSASSAKTPAKAEGSEERVQILKAHHLRPAVGAKKDRTRVGRGEGSKGKTAGRGTKGSKARYQVRAGLEGGNLNQIMRAPKLRGFKNPFRVEYQVVNLTTLAQLYPSGGEVTVSDLVAKGAVRKNEKVKVLGSGDIAVKLTVAVDKVSGSAEQKILAAGGSVRQ